MPCRSKSAPLDYRETQEAARTRTDCPKLQNADAMLNAGKDVAVVLQALEVSLHSQLRHELERQLIR